MRFSKRQDRWYVSENHRKENLSSADKRLSSAVALVRVGRALLSSFSFPDTQWCPVL